VQPSESGHSSEPAQPITEAWHQPEAEEQLQREEQPGTEPDHTESAQPSERQCDTAPAELPGEETGGVRRRCRWWIAPVVVLSLAVVALGVFVILAHAAPDFIDSILYTPEELKILNY